MLSTLAGAPSADSRSRPDLDVAVALAALHALAQQLSREDPLDRLVEAHVERDADRVGVLAGVQEACHQGDDRLLGNDKPEAELGRYGGAAVHRVANLNLAGSREPGTG